MVNAFIFETDDLRYDTIETEICERCGIGTPQSSNFPPELTTEKTYEFSISCISKGVSGKLYAFGSNGHFTVDVSCLKYYQTAK